MRCRMTSSGGDDHVLALRGAAIAARAAIHTSRVRTSYRCQLLHDFKAIAGLPRLGSPLRRSWELCAADRLRLPGGQPAQPATAPSSPSPSALKLWCWDDVLDAYSAA